ncbi:MAG: ABC transporter permease [Candidatus Aenigmatarchaeota archaeon]
MKEKMKFPVRYGRKFYGNLKKDLMLFYNRKKYLYIFLIFPVLIAGLFLFLLSPTTADISVGVCDLDQTPETNEMLTGLEDFDIDLLERENCTKNLKEGIKRGDFELGLKIDEGFTEDIENLEQAPITTYHDNTDIALSKMVSWRVDSSLKPYERRIIDNLNEELKQRVSVARESIKAAEELTEENDPLHERITEIDQDLESVEELNTDFLINPIRTDTRGLYDELDMKYISISFLYPIITLFLILMLASISIIYDDKTGFITKVKTSTTILTYVFSKILFFFILSSIIFALFFGIFLLAGASLSFNFIEVIKLIFLVSITNSLIGMLIGHIAENEGIAILMSLFISFPLMLLSGLFFPLQNMPSLVQSVVRVLPLHLQIEATKSVILFNQSLGLNLVYLNIPLLLFTIYFIRKNI